MQLQGSVEVRHHPSSGSVLGFPPRPRRLPRGWEHVADREGDRRASLQGCSIPDLLQGKWTLVEPESRTSVRPCGILGPSGPGSGV